MSGYPQQFTLALAMLGWLIEKEVIEMVDARFIIDMPELRRYLAAQEIVTEKVDAVAGAFTIIFQATTEGVPPEERMTFELLLGKAYDELLAELGQRARG